MKKLFLLLLLLLVSCSTPEEEINRVIPEIIFFQEPKSKLCFAYFWQDNYALGHGGPAFTNVPCESVKDLLVKESLTNNEIHN